MATSADNTSLKTQYTAQITADLERNAAEHERLSADIATMQGQLSALENNRALLLSMRQTLDTEATGDAPDDTGVSGLQNGSSPTRKSAPLSARKPKKKPDTTSGKRKEAESGRSRTKRAREGVPTLGDLLRDDLTQHGEPRSAAEITAALTQVLPDREIKATVVRSTLESLVAKGQAHRTKQQRSVYYSAAAPEAAAGTADPSDATAS
ncbi:hypothetical protein [Streptomyces iranensis]|uniref:Regulatory protein n=1 Tax=Streptomyces iranensis TaxID=576784 RepID=A0A061A574_9ACTN|nr:hypothetical protein [Streptomyces iranensis]MBP2067707.1 hypothetical protein [Streptomyces iranensis]CDR17983.1 regulatory protein [Streptomyces iranensis]